MRPRALVAKPALLERRLSVHAEAAVVVGVLLAWQAARIPLEGSSAQALSHARSWLSLEDALRLRAFDDAVISLAQRDGVIHVARWVYSNLHVFTIVAFMVAVRAAAPDRYPALRTAFVLLHLPALAAIGAFPLASPTWLAHPPQWAGAAPYDPQLTATLSAALRNSTAAVASEHFGYTVFIAAGTLWSARRSRLAWLTLAYPPLIFLAIVGTGHHYTLDALVGALSVSFGIAAARVLHGSQPPARVAVPEPWARTIGLAVGYALLVDWADGLSADRVALGRASALTFAAPATAAVAFALAAKHRASAPA
jgi:hypothetical protein